MTVGRLTNRQQEELNKSIVAYISQIENAPSELVGQLSQLLGLPEDAHLAGHEARSELARLLEMKWTSVVRLQKKVMELETKNEELERELEETSTLSSQKRRNGDGAGKPEDCVPRSTKYLLTGAREALNALAFHPIVSQIAVASEDSFIRIYDWDLGDQEFTLKGHTKTVLDVDFSPGTTPLLASCSSDLTIKIWDPSNQYEIVRTMTGHDHTISAIKFTPDGEHLVSASRDQTTRIWQVSTGYCISVIKGIHHDWIKSVDVSAGYILTAGADRMAAVCELQTTNTSFAPKSKLELRGPDGHGHVIEQSIFAPPTASKYLSAMEGLERPTPSQFSSSFNYLVTASRDKSIKLWNAHGECIKTLIGHDNWVRALAFHPLGKILISVSDDKTIRFWDLGDGGRCIKVLKDHKHFVTCVKWVPNQNDRPRYIMATGSVDKQARVWG